MKFASKVRADWRAPTCAALIGSGVGLALGAAYLAGGMARAVSDHSLATRVAEAAGGGYGDEVLLRREIHDVGAAHIVDRREAQPGETPSFGPELIKAAAAVSSGTIGAPAAPFKMVGALESSRELECLTQAVYFEARGETPAGQAAVAQVVLNRVRHPSFPKSVCAVVFQGAGKRVGCQFSFACNGSMQGRRENAAWDRARRVATRALGGFVMTAVGESTHFHTVNVAPNWGARLVRTAEVGMHIFYKFGRGAPRLEEKTYYASLATPTPPHLELESDLHLAVAKAVDAPTATQAAETRLTPAVEAKATPAAGPMADAKPAAAAKPVVEPSKLTPVSGEAKPLAPPTRLAPPETTVGED